VTVHIPQVLAAEFWSRWPDEFRPSPPSTAPLAAAGSCDRVPDGPGANSLAAFGTTNPTPHETEPSAAHAGGVDAVVTTW